MLTDEPARVAPATAFDPDSYSRVTFDCLDCGTPISGVEQKVHRATVAEASQRALRGTAVEAGEVVGPLLVSRARGVCPRCCMRRPLTGRRYRGTLGPDLVNEPAARFAPGPTRVGYSLASTLGRAGGMAVLLLMLRRHVRGDSGVHGLADDAVMPMREEMNDPLLNVASRNAGAIRAGLGTVRSEYPPLDLGLPPVRVWTEIGVDFDGSENQTFMYCHGDIDPPY